MINNIIYFSKFILFIFIFTFFVILQNSLYLDGIGNSFIPELSLFFVYYTFFLKKSISYFGVFLLGVIFDSINILPTGITSISIILSIGLTNLIVSKTLFDITKHKYIIFLIFFIIYTFLKLFLMIYIYNKYFVLSITYIVLNFLYFYVFDLLISKIDKIIEEKM